MTRARSDLGIGPVGFGAAAIGNLYQPISDRDAREAVDAAWTGGVRYFDTAPHYGLGLSERRLGAALSRYPRSSYVLSTKVGRLLVPNPAPTGSDLPIGGFAVDDALTRRRDYSKSGVLRSLDESLARLGTDHVDIVYVHDPDDHMADAIGEAIPALVQLRDQGVVRAVGAGMNTVNPLRRIVAESDVDVVMVAGRWTLLDRTAAELLADCADRGVRVVAAAPFNSGLLARPWPTDGAHFDYAPASEAVLELARQYAQVCFAHQTTLPAAALQFPLRSAVVDSVVVGPANREQVEECLQWSRAPVSEETWRGLSACHTLDPRAS